MPVNPSPRLLPRIEQRALAGMVFLALDDVDNLKQHPKPTIGVFPRLALDTAFHGPALAGAAGERNLRPLSFARVVPDFPDFQSRVPSLVRPSMH